MHEREVKQAGLTVAVSSPLLTAAQTVGQMGKAVGRSTTLAVEKVKEIADDLKSETARAALHGIVGCAGAAAVGSACGAGATGGAASVVLGNLLNAVANTSTENLSQREKEARMNLIESVVAGITAGTGGDATAASVASRLELENNQFQLPQGIVRAGAASASLGEFMAKNGASDEDIQQAQSDLLRGLGTDAAQPATELLKNWAVLMAAAPSIAGGVTATVSSMAAGGAIGGTSNVLVQSALNGEKDMSSVDVLIAIATGAATQGRGILATVSTSASGAAMGAIIKGDDVTNAAVGAASGAAIGTQAGKVITKAAAGLVTDTASGTAGSLTGSFVSEFIS
ncbi:filamentous hemagglutinin family N-terminal domain protein [Pandoraea sp. SD6-2]|nr:filamentous hemagglutinin family N-terminal domain protein [Pandoraea sp. SD6-2]